MSSLMLTGVGPTNGGSQWTPASLSNLGLWLRGDMGITLNGTDVSAWADQSGNGRDYTQAVALAQPAYLATGGPNSTPCLDFDGLAKFMASAGWTESGAGTLVVVHKLDTSPVGGAMGCFTISDGTNHNDFQFIQFAGYTEYNVVIGGGGSLVGFSPFDLTGFKAMVFSYNGSGSGTGANYDAYVNGISQPIVASSSGAAYSSGSEIGRRMDVGTAYMDGKVSEIIMRSVATTGTDLTSLLAYLTARYS